VHLAGVPQEGMAVDVTGSSGVVEFTEDHPYDIDSRDDKQRIPFQLSEVGCKLYPPLGFSVVVISRVDMQNFMPSAISGCRHWLPG